MIEVNDKGSEMMEKNFQVPVETSPIYADKAQETNDTNGCHLQGMKIVEDKSKGLIGSPDDIEVVTTGVDSAVEEHGLQADAQEFSPARLQPGKSVILIQKKAVSLSDTSPTAFEEARLYGGIVGGAHVDPWAPRADSENWEDFYDEDDGFQPVKGKREKSASKTKAKKNKPKRQWNYSRQFD